MLAIRMQRTGRTSHAQFRLIVQESRLSPKSGNIVVSIGSYDPHTKQVIVDKDKAAFYLEHGAQPSSRVALLLKKEGVKLPKWVKFDHTKEAAIRNPEKRRSTRPAEEVVANEAKAEVKAEEPATEAEAPVTEEAVAEVAEAPTEETAEAAKTEEEV